MTIRIEKFMLTLTVNFQASNATRKLSPFILPSSN